MCVYGCICLLKISYSIVCMTKTIGVWQNNRLDVCMCMCECVYTDVLSCVYIFPKSQDQTECLYLGIGIRKDG